MNPMLYGLPHVGAEYTGDGARRYQRTQEWCFVCGRPATNCHHVVPLSNGEFFERVTPNGAFRLRSRLMTLCGSGTTGCHGRIHARILVPEWVWDEPEFEDAWERGELLRRFKPHNRALYCYGHWEIRDENGRVTAYREEY